MTDSTIKESSVDHESPDNVPPLSPIGETKRIDAMDILRGLALIGILLMNIEWFGRSILDLGSFDNSLTGLDHAVGWLIRCFVEGKFYKLFALLFGMGFAVMLIRAREAGRPFGAWFTRRMMVLFVFGMLHMIFLWSGDILHDYAIAGFVFLGWVYLFQTRRLKKFDNPRSFLKIGLVWLSIPIVLSTLAAIGFSVMFDHEKLTEQWQQDVQVAALVTTKLESQAVAEEDVEIAGDDDEPGAVDAANPTDELSEPTTELSGDSGDDAAKAESELSEQEQIEKEVSEAAKNRREFEEKKSNEIAAFSEGSYWEATKQRLAHTTLVLKFAPALTFLILIPIFLVGYWLISSGTLRNHKENAHIFKPMAWLGMSFGLFFTVGGLMVTQHPVAETSGSLLATGEVLFFLGQYVLSAGYLGTVVTLLSSPKWSRRLDRFAPMGKMALTNYIMHSVVLTSLFYGYAGGLYGQVSRSPQMLIVVAIILFQVYFSSWWLKRYRFGPLEWLWRSLTYKQFQAMRLDRR